MIRPVVSFNIREALMFAFVALGPIGNMLTPHFLPDSFRAYYFLLPLFPFFFAVAYGRAVKVGIIFLPLLTYCLISACNVEFVGASNEPFPLFRYCLLFCQFSFIIGAASFLENREQIYRLIKTYLNFYFVSLAIGWFFFIGYYLKVVSLGLITRFSVLTQFGWGILRFSPGSYPNEYGIVSSFALSLLTLIYLEKKNSPVQFPKFRFLILFIATFLAFLLATTRAAYLSYLVCALYLIWTSGAFIKNLVKLACFFTGCLGLLAFKLNMFKILNSGFSQKMDQGSLGERYFAWINATQRAGEHPLLGVGFGSLTNIHNVYLQLLFELGIVGSVVFFGCLVVFVVETFFRYGYSAIDQSSRFLHKVKMLGLINVLSFAASNHNLNHHLTWFTFFLCLAGMKLQLRKKPLAF